MSGRDSFHRLNCFKVCYGGTYRPILFTIYINKLLLTFDEIAISGLADDANFMMQLTFVQV